MRLVSDVVAAVSWFAEALVAMAIAALFLLPAFGLAFFALGEWSDYWSTPWGSLSDALTWTAFTGVAALPVLAFGALGLLGVLAASGHLARLVWRTKRGPRAPDLAERVLLREHRLRDRIESLVAVREALDDVPSADLAVFTGVRRVLDDRRRQTRGALLRLAAAEAITDNTHADDVIDARLRADTAIELAALAPVATR